jgi:hypothetical protein
MIKLAFLYKPNNPYLCGLRPNNNFKKFYLEALKRNPDVEVSYFGSDTELDCKTIPKHDVYLFFDTIEWGIPVLRNLDHLKGLRVASINDAHSFGAVSKEFNRTRKQMLFDMNIDYCYYQHTPDYFHKFYPEVDNYWWIPIGFDAELYKDVKPWEERRGDKILLTGVLGTEYYGFRELCKKHPNVEYVPPGNYEKRRYKKSKNDGDNYKRLLERYKFAIASGYSVINKYFEICAAGCSNIIHIDEENNIHVIGFGQYWHGTMVNKDNLNEMLYEIGAFPDAELYRDRAEAGRKFVFEHYTHDKCVERLIDHIKKVL